MTRSDIISFLEGIGCDDAQTEATIIIEELFSVSPALQLADRNREYDSQELSLILKKRQEHVPLAYVLGYAYFRNERYEVNEACLIPRSDTELLVERSAELLGENAKFADLCTGTGCISISLLCEKRNATALAVDISETAVETAKRNAHANNVSERFDAVCADVFTLTLPNGKLDAIVSNPPYIKTSVVPTLSEEVKHEPKIALDGGEDGMDFYRHIVATFKDALKEDGFFAFEIGYDQKESIEQTAADNGMSCAVSCDLSGNPRVAILKKLN